jgi:hypothetical protein
VLSGAQEPRVYLAPQADSSSWQDAADLADAYGLTADPWQELVLDGAMGERADGKWAAPRVGLAVPRQNGKNAILEIRELAGMVLLGERILHTAHEVKTARKAFLRLLEFFDDERRYPDLFALVKGTPRKTNGQEAIYLTNGGSIEFVARSKGSGRGFSVDLLVMDEAQDLTEDHIAALMPTISASGNPQRWYTGTPPSPSMQGEVFTRVRAAGLAGEDTRLCWAEWSVESSKDLDVDDEALWALANPSLGIRLERDTIADERADMDEETFARERLGVWTPLNAAGVIPVDLWASLSDEESTPMDPVALGFDVSPNRVATISVCGPRVGGGFHVEVIESRAGTGWVPDRLLALQQQWFPVATVMDPTGPAGSLIPMLKERGVDFQQTTAREMAQACGAFLSEVLEGRVHYRERFGISDAVKIARKRPLGDAWAWARKDSSADISPLVSTTLALHGQITGATAASTTGWMVSL